MVLMLGVAAVFAALTTQIGDLYTRDPVLRGILDPVLTVLIFVLVVDGGQGVMVNAVRGRGDTWAATALAALSFLAVMLPAAWWLAIEAGRGVVGLFEATLIGCSVALAALAWRFHVLTRGGRGGRTGKRTLPFLSIDGGSD
jgi:Na+-driven multidrug efflux pump